MGSLERGDKRRPRAQGDQVGLCRRGRRGKRLSKHPSNSKGSELVCPAATAEGHTDSSPGRGRPDLGVRGH